MNRHKDGFDWNASTANPLVKYPGSLVTFIQTAAVAGRFGQGALSLINSGFGEMNFTKVLGVGNYWFVGMAIAPHTTLKTDYSTLFFKMHTAGGGVLSFRYNPSFQLEVLIGGSGNELHPGTVVNHVSSPLFAIGTWVYWEFCFHQAGASSSLKIFANDVLVLDLGPPLNGEGSGADGPLDMSAVSGTVDRISFRWESLGGGYYIDDYYINDEQGTVCNGRLGPVRIVTTIPAVDEVMTGGWLRNTGSSDFSAVHEMPYSPGSAPFGAPDNDSTYLAVDNPFAYTLWKLSPFACTAKILSVSWNAVYKGLGSLTFLYNMTPPGLPVTLGSKSPTVTNAYENLQITSDVSLTTEDTWVDGELNDAWFGASADVAGSRLTQFYVEKMITLRNVPFSCGSGTTGARYTGIVQ